MAARILPLVRLLFACDEAVCEIDTQRWVLTNPWSLVTVPPGAAFPFRAEEFWVYVQLTDGLGQFELAVEMRQRVHDQSLRVVGWSSITRLEFPGAPRLLMIDTAFGLKHVPFREPGVHEIRILADGDEPGNWVPLAGTTYELQILDSRRVL